MADQNNTIKTTVVLDATQAQQQIVKLNAVASDSTKTLEQRVEAKNKQVKIQNDLSKQTINNLQNEKNKLVENGATLKEIKSVQDKLNKAKIAATKQSSSGAKQQEKLNQAYKDGKDPIKTLDKATGGLIGKMKMFLANPIGIVLTALVGLFQLVKSSMNATEDGAAAFNAVGAAMGQIFTNIITVVSDIFQPMLEWLAEFLAKDLGGAFQAMYGYVEALKLAFEAFSNVVKLTLTPLRSLIALATAAAKAVKGDFDGAKQVMVDFKQSVIDTAMAIKDNLVGAVELVKKTNEDVAESFEKSVDAGDSLIALAAQIELRQNAFNRAKRAQLLLDAKLAVMSRQEKANAKDKEKSDAEREASLKKFSELEQQREDASLARLQDEIKLKEDRNSLGKNTQADEEELNNLLIQREFIMERNAKRQGVVNAMMGEFVLGREADAKKEIASQIKLDGIEIERLRNKNELTLEAEIQFLKKKKDLELMNLDLTEKEKEVIRQKFIDSADAVKKAKDDLEKEEAAINLETELLGFQSELERKRLHGENVLALELELLEKRRAQELMNEDLTEAEKNAINAKYAELKIKSTVAYKNAEKKAIDAAAQFGAEALADAFGLSQELKIAQMTMNAPEAIGNSFTKAAEVYAPPISLAMGALGAAGVIVPIVKGLSDIKKQRFSGGKGRRSNGAASSISPIAGAGKGIGSSAISDIGANNAARMGIDPSLGSNSSANASNNILGGSANGIVFSESAYNDFQSQISFKESKTTI